MADTSGRYFTQWTEVATQNTNVAATATHAAVENQTHYITGYSVSTAAAPATTVSVTVANGVSTVERVELPAAAFSPIVVNFSAPIRCSPNTAASITCPAVGGATQSTVVLRGFTLY